MKQHWRVLIGISLDRRNELTKSQIERGIITGDENVSDFRELVNDRKVPLHAVQPF